MQPVCPNLQCEDVQSLCSFYSIAERRATGKFWVSRPLLTRAEGPKVVGEDVKVCLSQGRIFSRMIKGCKAAAVHGKCQAF